MSSGASEKRRLAVKMVHHVIQDMALVKEGRYLLLCTSERRIRARCMDGANVGTELPFILPEGAEVMSISSSRCGRYLLANVSGGGLRMWDLGAGPELPAAVPAPRRFLPDGPILPSRFIVRSRFGGLDERFVLSGCESGQVRLYLRETGRLLRVLHGHVGTVNAVAWHPTRPDTFATAADDGTVRIWQPEGQGSVGVEGEA